MPTIVPFLSIFIFGFAIPIMTSAEENVVPNPSFEEPVRGGMTESDWRFVPLTAEGEAQPVAMALIDEGQAHEGTGSLMIEGGAGVWMSPSIECKSNTPYRLTAWVKGESDTAGGPILTVQTFTADDKTSPGSPLPIHLTPDWQQVEIGFVSEPDAVRFRIDLNSLSPGKVCFDDVSLVEDPQGEHLPKVNVWHFAFEGENAMEGWSKTKGATVTPMGDGLQIQGSDWNSLIFRYVNLRAGTYRLSGSGSGKTMVIASKGWDVAKRLKMLNLSGAGNFRADEQTFDFPGGQFLLIVQAWGAEELATIEWIEIALESLVTQPSTGDRERVGQSIAAVTQKYEALKEQGGTTPAASSGTALERGAALAKPNAVIPILYPAQIRIDGDSKDWSAVPFVGTLSVNGENFPPPSSAADASATFKIAATDKMLALLILVHDEKLVFSKPSATCWNDTIEVFLDPLFTRGDRHADTSMQILITHKDQMMKELVVNGRIPLTAKPVTVADGWGVEIGIPLDNRIFRLHPFDGLPIGINISYNDNDQSKGREKKITWSALDTGDFSWMRTDVFGVGVFVSDVVMPVVPSAPSEAVMKAMRQRSGVESFTDVAVLARERPDPPVVRGFQSGSCSPEHLSEMKQWGANVVRVEMQNLKSYRALKNKSDLLKEENMKAYLDELEGIVKDARAADMKLLLANHGVVRPPNVVGNIADSANDINQKMYEFWEHPELESMFCSFWKSVAERLRPYHDTVWAYDLMNEPYDPNQMPHGPKQWPPLAVKAIKAIRSVDKDVWIDYEVGPGASPSGFRDMMPLPDPHIIYDFHMYLPHSFTHQGLQGYGDEGYGPAEKKIQYPGVIGGIPFNKDYLRKCMQPVVDFQNKWKVPVNIGEFSVISWAPPESAAAYLSDVISIFEENGWSWDYHAYAEFQGWNPTTPDGVYWRHWKNELPPEPSATDTARGKVLREALGKNAKVLHATDKKPGVESRLSMDGLKPEFPVYSDPNADVGPEAFKILIVGNSISRNGFNEQTIKDLKWDHTAGMAATSEDKDYVHTLAQ